MFCNVAQAQQQDDSEVEDGSQHGTEDVSFDGSQSDGHSSDSGEDPDDNSGSDGATSDGALSTDDD